MKLEEKIKKSIKEMAIDVWELRRDAIKEMGFNKNDILTNPLDFNSGDEYMQLSWEEGYIYALQQVQDEIKEGRSNL